MINLSSRSSETELMDDLNCEGEVIHQTLHELDIINRRLGGNYVSIQGLKELVSTHNKAGVITLADLGCGGGDILIYMARWARSRNIAMKFVGIDANPNIIAYAENHCQAYDEISFLSIDIFSDEFKSLSFDIVHSSLFTHHFDQESLIKIFSTLRNQTKLGIIINDLHRHWLAYYSIKMITRFFSKSAMVRNDAAVSVARGFLKKDLAEVLSKSGFVDYSIKWRWAFRWKVVAGLKK